MRKSLSDGIDGIENPAAMEMHELDCLPRPLALVVKDVKTLFDDLGDPGRILKLKPAAFAAVTKRLTQYLAKAASTKGRLSDAKTETVKMKTAALATKAAMAGDLMHSFTLKS